jgi:hypothetical protein
VTFIARLLLYGFAIGLAFGIMACALADDWEKYNQPGQKPGVRDADMTDPQRAAIDKVLIKMQRCRDSAMAYQHMKANMVDLAVEAHTKKPQPLDYYHEAYKECMARP